MNNYLLSIDPSIKNTGFTLWEKECKTNCRYLWKPIWIKSYSFENYFDLLFLEEYIYKIKNIIWEYTNSKCVNWTDFLNICIERGFPGMMGSETQDHLRGFIAGQFNKLLTKNMLISPKEWQNWYTYPIHNNKSYTKTIVEKNNISYKKWDKEYSLLIAKELINENNWNIIISKCYEADSLLIGWYYLNKDVK